MTDKSSTGHARDPRSTNVWLFGSGIASLAAAVHLIDDAHVPGLHIHILDRHEQTGSGITSSGDANTGFIINPESLPLSHIYEVHFPRQKPIPSRSVAPE
jgi:oleate hydratase